MSEFDWRAQEQALIDEASQGIERLEKEIERVLAQVFEQHVGDLRSSWTAEQVSMMSFLRYQIEVCRLEVIRQSGMTRMFLARLIERR
ncbi:MAG: hypothetical protein HY319_01600 [Armatimonadetes bacterium]|nr:hypothetical protein [Armatimonadota bacterium]